MSADLKGEKFLRSHTVTQAPTPFGGAGVSFCILQGDFLWVGGGGDRKEGVSRSACMQETQSISTILL